MMKRSMHLVDRITLRVSYKHMTPSVSVCACVSFVSFSFYCWLQFVKRKGFAACTPHERFKENIYI